MSSRTAIIARFPLGVFRGNEPDGTPSLFPSPSRLFSALTHSAGKGTTAVEVQGDLRPAPPAASALRWLEAHPPTAIHLPEAVPTSDAGYAIYRAEGVLGKSNTDRKTLRPLTGTAIQGELAWIWDEGFPDNVRDVVDELLGDIACLGEADSPVVLELGTAEPTHHLDPTATDFSYGGLRLEAAGPGRFDELEAAYDQANPANRKPARPQTPYATITTRLIPRTATQRVTYRPISSDAPPNTPWIEGRALPLQSGRTPSPTAAVAACVTLHRSLALLLPQDAPATITGKYADGVQRPPNRVALHFLDESLAPKAGLTESSFLVMIPQGMETEELELLDHALAQIRFLNGRGVNCELKPPRTVPTHEFWLPPPEGTKRVWWGYPALIPETRSRDPRWGGASRTFEEAALLSVGLVLRDRLNEDSITSTTRWRDIVDQVRAWGVNVLMTQRVPTTQPSRYVHRVPDGMVVEPYRALIDLGGSVPDTSLIALGQNRHLGGGLLVPEDLSPGAVDIWRSA